MEDGHQRIHRHRHIHHRHQRIHRHRHIRRHRHIHRGHGPGLHRAWLWEVEDDRALPDQEAATGHRDGHPLALADEPATGQYAQRALDRGGQSDGLYEAWGAFPARHWHHPDRGGDSAEEAGALRGLQG